MTIKMFITGKMFLSNNITHIFSGDDINLSIEIQNQEKIFVKAIFLNFRGEINVKWEDLINKPKDGKIIYIMQQFEGQEIYVNQQIILQNMGVLNMGKHIYNISLNIPRQLPQTVNRKYGSVKYELELGVHMTRGIEILYKMPVVIKRYVNICLTKEYMQPFQTVFKKYFCWGICSSRPLKVSLTLPATSFIVGQSIKYFVLTDNFNKFMNLCRLSAILTQTQHYKALKPKPRIKQVHTTLNIMIHHFNNSHHNSKFEGSLKLPQSLEPTSLEPELLTTSYNLKFILVFKGFQSDGYISIPIIVGSHKNDAEKICDFSNSETKIQIEREFQAEYQV